MLFGCDVTSETPATVKRTTPELKSPVDNNDTRENEVMKMGFVSPKIEVEHKDSLIPTEIKGEIAGGFQFVSVVSSVCPQPSVVMRDSPEYSYVGKLAFLPTNSSAQQADNRKNMINLKSAKKIPTDSSDCVDQKFY